MLPLVCLKTDFFLANSSSSGVRGNGLFTSMSDVGGGGGSGSALMLMVVWTGEVTIELDALLDTDTEPVESDDELVELVEYVVPQFLIGIDILTMLSFF